MEFRIHKSNSHPGTLSPECIWQHEQTRNIFMCLASRPRLTLALHCCQHRVAMVTDTLSPPKPENVPQSNHPHSVLYRISLPIYVSPNYPNNRWNDQDMIKSQFYGRNFAQSAHRTWGSARNIPEKWVRRWRFAHDIPAWSNRCRPVRPPVVPDLVVRCGLPGALGYPPPPLPPFKKKVLKKVLATKYSSSF